MEETKRFRVSVIHVYEFEAHDEDEAVQMAIDASYSEARDCQIEAEEIEQWKGSW